MKAKPYIKHKGKYIPLENAYEACHDYDEDTEVLFEVEGTMLTVDEFIQAVIHSPERPDYKMMQRVIIHLQEIAERVREFKEFCYIHRN